METNTKYYDEESSEEEGQLQSEKETRLVPPRTWYWSNDWVFELNNGTEWAKLSNMNCALTKRANGTCHLHFSVDITSLGWRTRNSPFSEANPTILLRFKNLVGVVLFSVKIETEDYGTNLYHGLTVRCEYDREPKDSTYELGVVPFDDIHVPSRSKPGGRTIYPC